MDWQNAVFAPGWFWSMASTILIVGSLIGLYRQLRLQSSQGAWDQLEAIENAWGTERMDRSKLQVLLAIRDHPDRSTVPPADFTTIGGYWERIGALATTGNVDLKLLHAFNGGACPVWWVALAPVIQQLRADTGNPEEYRAFERLSAAIDRLDIRTGAGQFDEAALMGSLAGRIAVLEGRLEVEKELRATSGAAGS